MMLVISAMGRTKSRRVMVMVMVIIVIMMSMVMVMVLMMMVYDSTAISLLEIIICVTDYLNGFQDSKDNGANMGPTWVLSAPGGPHVDPWTLLSGLVQDWGNSIVNALELPPSTSEPAISSFIFRPAAQGCTSIQESWIFETSSLSEMSRSNRF